ncbi:ras-related protein rab-5c [Anaeramoeba flamelloides]|uniref:Ras-related protein rab-5c n=1 Tax=Anaeramoeba flamelloides TaxID=1746091 RepID=A0AAV8AEF1_9EUKA|nr:ras-related protein rab-5c [Anaeramoeba flamelloides]KAJ6226286.1 ras-related protein rab-5c [Anaeramoeba flamelloides]
MNFSSGESSEEEELQKNVIKIVMLGQSGCGKTSLVIRYIDDNFSENTSTTIGAAFFLKTLVINDETVNVRLWDTSGQERFKSLVPLYYRHAAGAVLVFDPKEKLSFEKLKYWHNELQNNCDNVPLMAIAANKDDHYENISENNEMLQKAQDYAKEIGAGFFRTSAKTGKSVKGIFDHLIRQIVEKRKKLSTVNESIDDFIKPTTQEKKANSKNNNKQGGGCC